ncbi:hypothetical protein QQS21_003949 [Conoideocrella luteorostrata]|uniref:Peptidase M43 pregnancy-associated plasma-A domain-containing protein n=1 Tax=Conoideocrella luteorostrata TaxID=1105319 RepID=A0AAJ0CSE3_9HYPO|nr:hypothetical protein QQS21_003949 [Conoideocrella luteorostrata]
MSSLNRAFRTAKISFNLINTTWNVKPHLAEGKDDKRMKYLHHRGDNRDLNVYYVHHSSEEDDSAFAEFPDQATDHLGVLSDGVTIPAWASTEQATFVHEVGHWLGLLHTFHYGPEPDNGCIGDGDMISDTPAHRNASWECPSDPPLNTCPSLPGDDPVHNYMNDLPDECYEGYWDRGFTNEQIKHVRSLLKQFRSESIPKPTWPSELKRLTPSDKGGKLPFYPEPENPVLTFLQCGSTDNGTVPEAPEEYCGTLYFCNAAAKRQVSDIEQVDDVLQATLRCAKQRDPSQTL